MAHAETEHSGKMTEGKVLAFSLADVLRTTIQLVTSYRDEFKRAQGEVAKLCFNQFETPMTQNESHGRSATISVTYSKAGISGELYPGRPLIRPRIIFPNEGLTTGSDEECSKDYRRLFAFVFSNRVFVDLLVLPPLPVYVVL